MLEEVFAGPRGKLQENYGFFGETKTFFYRRPGLTPAAEKTLREQVATFYKVNPTTIEIIAVREFAQYFLDDQSFGEVELEYRPYCKAFWGICGNEDRSNAHFVCFAT